MANHVATWAEVGLRVTQAREALRLTQAKLAAAADISLPALVAIETGRRPLSAPELLRLATATEQPLEWFVLIAPESVRSRRAELAGSEGSAAIDLQLDRLARDVELLVELGELKPQPRFRLPQAPASFEEVEAGAERVRAFLEESGPLGLGAAAERLGLYVFALPLTTPSSTPEGAYVALDRCGVALLNGDLDAGRRRYTAAHEIGHHVFRDAYSTDWDLSTASQGERLINAFAVHLLLPRPAVTSRWAELSGPAAPRTAAIHLAAEFRTSWTATCNQVRTLGLIDDAQRAELLAWPPRHADYLELELDFAEEFAVPYLPSKFVAAALRAYSRGKIGARRAVELLRGKLSADELPVPDPLPLEALTGDLRSG